MHSDSDNDPAVRPLLVALDSEEDEDPGFDAQVPQSPLSGTMLPLTSEDVDEDSAVWLADLQSRPWHLRPSIYWLMPLLVIQGLAVGLMGSPMDQLIIQIICRDYLGASSILNATLLLPDDRCKSPDVLAAAALTQSRIQAIKGAITLLTLAKWTSLSDIYGRKLLIRIAMVSITVSQMLTWFAATGHNPLGYRLLYLDGVLLGLVPGGQIVSPALFAYIVGTVVGPYLGGYIVRETGDLTSVIKISIAVYALMALYLIFVPESLRRENQKSALKATVEQIRQDHAGPYTAVKSSVAVKIGGSMKRGSALEAISMVGETSSRSLLTTIIPAHQTGKVMGALSVSNSIASTLANLIYGHIFAFTSTTVPWFYFYVSAGITVVSLLVVYSVWRSYRLPQRHL
ncbi:hypothetical protein EC968_004267 [Mortierella alpina]|nr:hypothetical protein EC968_004267 [Mortierella alpina]